MHMNGSCLCGKVKFKIDGLLQNIANCHCSMCRKFHGAAFGTYGTAVSLNWVSGEELIKIYKSSEKAERGFCSNCGSSIYYKPANPNSPWEIALGVLDQEPNYPVNADIYCSSRATWSENMQNLPQYSEGRT